jgi:hypothetical protein
MLNGSQELDSALKENGDGTWWRRTSYIGGFVSEEQRRKGGVELDTSPQGYLVEFHTGPGATASPPHFHRSAQFQVIVSGDGRIGKRQVPPVSFQFADPFTPYGPIVVSDDADGIAFFTLRAVGDQGAHIMPGSRDEMEQLAGRNIAVTLPRDVELRNGVQLEQLIELHPDGLAAHALRLGPGERAVGPSAADSGGQFYVVTRGSFEHAGSTYVQNRLLFVEPGEDAPELVAGDEGAEVLVLQFPVNTGA